MDSVTCSSSDALDEARTIQIEASEVGFDWSHVPDVIAKVREEIDEIEKALERGDGVHAKVELGDLLFSAVNLSRFLDANPVEELRKANRKFLARFARLKEVVRESGRDMAACSLEELDEVWERIKGA